jgi:hypothetical protein
LDRGIDKGVTNGVGHDTLQMRWMIAGSLACHRTDQTRVSIVPVELDTTLNNGGDRTARSYEAWPHAEKCATSRALKAALKTGVDHFDLPWQRTNPALVRRCTHEPISKDPLSCGEANEIGIPTQGKPV